MEISTKYTIALNMFTVMVALWHTQQREINPQYTPYFVYSSYRACIEYMSQLLGPHRGCQMLKTGQRGPQQLQKHVE